MPFVTKLDPSIPSKTLLDQLDKQNIVYTLVDQAGGRELWLDDPSLVEPVQAYYQQYCEQYHNRLSFKNLKRTPITTSMLIITGLTALITLMGSQNIEYFLMAKLQYYPRSWFYFDGMSNLWHFISPTFLHFGVEHLLFNVLSFWFLGSAVEKAVGMKWYALLVIVMALASNFAQLLSSGPLFGGLSGVVYGLIGFVFVYQKMIANLAVPQGLIYVAIIWMALGATDALAMIGFGNMANAAHLAGLLSGFILIFIYQYLTKQKVNV